MISEVKYLTSATSVFLSLQSGHATPYWEVNITVSGAATTVSGSLGAAYNADNHIVSMGSIDREKPIRPSDLSDIYKGDLLLTLNNMCGTYSPLATASIFTDAQGSALDFMQSTINVWAGFVNLSGTAYVVQRGSFLMTKVEIDNTTQEASFTCEDAAKKLIDNYLAPNGLSGTSMTWLPTSGYTVKNIMSEILSAVALTAGQYDLASGYSFTNYQVSNEGVASAIASLAQASDGFVFTNGNGQIVFKRNTPTWAGIAGGTSDYTLKDNLNIMRMKYSVDNSNLVKHVIVNYTSGLGISRSAEDTGVSKGKVIEINNQTIDRNALANALASRTLGQYSKNRYFIELDGLFLPSIEIGDTIDIYDTNTYQTSVAYTVYRVREDIVNCKSKLYGVTDLQRGQKWWFCSSSGEANSGGVFTDSWHSGFAFACVNPSSIPIYNHVFDKWDNGENSAPNGWLPRSQTFTRENLNETGTYSMGLTPDGSFLYPTLYDVANPTGRYHGHTMVVSMWVRTTGSNVRAAVNDGGGFSYSTICARTDAWEQLTVTGILSATASVFRISISQVQADQNEKIYIDNVTFAYNNPSFDADGDTDGAVTTGYAASGAGTTGIELPFLMY